MKKMIAVFLLLPLSVLAQQRDSVPVKKANRIVVVTNKPAFDNYGLLKTLFSANGYTIKTMNGDSLTVHSEQLRTKSVTITFSIDGWARENEIILSGNYFSRVDNSISGGSYKIFTNEISNTGGRESASKFTFQLLQNLAAQAGGKLFYVVDKTKNTSVF